MEEKLKYKYRKTNMLINLIIYIILIIAISYVSIKEFFIVKGSRKFSYLFLLGIDLILISMVLKYIKELNINKNIIEVSENGIKARNIGEKELVFIPWNMIEDISRKEKGNRGLEIKYYRKVLDSKEVDIPKFRYNYKKNNTDKKYEGFEYEVITIESLLDENLSVVSKTLNKKLDNKIK